MKNYEFFNQEFSKDETPELQAAKMTLSDISENLGIDFEKLEPYAKRFVAQLKWLNEEVR